MIESDELVLDGHVIRYDSYAACIDFAKILMKIYHAGNNGKFDKVFEKSFTHNAWYYAGTEVLNIGESVCDDESFMSFDYHYIQYHSYLDKICVHDSDFKVLPSHIEICNEEMYFQNSLLYTNNILLLSVIVTYLRSEGLNSFYIDLDFFNTFLEHL